MSVTATILVVLFAGGMLFTAVVFAARLYFYKELARTVSPGEGPLADESRSTEAAINEKLKQLEPMLPASALGEFQNQIAGFKSELAAETTKLKDIETRLHEAQQDVAKRESKHNRIKQGKDDSEQLAVELKDTQARLMEESKHLEVKIAQSQTELETLLEGIQLSEKQEAALNDIKNVLAKKREHLLEIADVYEVTTKRFLNLKLQYEQLELEYHNLVEEQLTGAG